MQTIYAQIKIEEDSFMKCLHFTKVGGLLDRVSQYIQAPGEVNHDLSNGTAHSITRIYFSYCWAFSIFHTTVLQGIASIMESNALFFYLARSLD